MEKKALNTTPKHPVRHSTSVHNYRNKAKPVTNSNHYVLIKAHNAYINL